MGGPGNGSLDSRSACIWSTFPGTVCHAGTYLFTMCGAHTKSWSAAAPSLL